MRAVLVLAIPFLVFSHEDPSRASSGARDRGAISASLSGSTLTLEGDTKLTLDRSASAMQSFEFASHEPSAGIDLVRWFPPALYDAQGVASPAYVIYSRGLGGAQGLTDQTNAFALSYPPVDPEIRVDQAFRSFVNELRRTNVAAPGRKICTANKGGEIRNQVWFGNCYVSCSGLAIVIADHSPRASRLVLMWASSRQIDKDVIFTESEGHTTVEIMGPEGWFVTDPTFGFAYVERRGKRLDVSHLIAMLATNRAIELEFTVVSGGELRKVPGPAMLSANPSLAGLYYTTDKTFEVHERSDKPEFVPGAAEG